MVAFLRNASLRENIIFYRAMQAYGLQKYDITLATKVGFVRKSGCK
jgi:hypothetical protein